MKVIDECCCECTTQNLNKTKESCPVCNNEGVTVSRITVEHLVTDDNRKAVWGDNYRICMNEDCDVAYYNVDNGIKFLKVQVSVPIWFGFINILFAILFFIPFINLLVFVTNKSSPTN